MNPRIPLAVLLIGALAANPLPPGDTLGLTGESLDDRPEWFGIAVTDQLRPFSIENGSGTVILSGNLQDRCLQSNVGRDLVFLPWLRDLETPSGTGRVVALVLNGHAGATIDAGYAENAQGEAPSSVARSAGPGDQLVISFGGVVPPERTRAVHFLTDAGGYDFAGSVTVIAEDGPGGARFEATIAGTAAPVLFDRSIVPVLSFQKDGSSFDLHFHAEARSYYQLWTAPSPGGPWTFRFDSFKRSTPAEMSFSPFEPVDGREFYKLVRSDDSM